MPDKPVTDADAEEWHAHLTMPRTDGKQDDREEFILALLADRSRDKERIVALVETLGFYANPGTYFAIGFFPDPPCGDFAADTSETHLGMKPGKRARALLLELAQEVQDAE